MPLSSVSFSWFYFVADDMSKSKELVLRLFIVPCLLKGHSKLSATASWSEGFWERVWTKPKREALLGTVDFFEIPLNASYIPPQPTFAPLLQHKVLTAATHYQRMNLTPVWMPLHELIVQKVTARIGLWSKQWNGAPYCQRWDNSLFPKSRRETGASYRRQAAVEATEWQNDPHGCYVMLVRVARQVFQFSRDSVNSVITREQESVFHWSN